MNGLHELPLVIFTVLAQSVVGAFLLFAIVLFTTEDKHYRVYVHKAMFVLLALLGIGFIASITHLGSPLRAFNALNRVGESMLSNEIATGALFFALAGIYWLFAILDKLPKAFGRFLLVCASAMGLIFMYMMNKVYHISTVPTWHTSFTTWGFYLTIILAGFTLGYGLLHSERPDAKVVSWVPTLVSITTLAAATVIIYQGFALSTVVTSAQKATALVPDFATLSALRFVLLGLAIACLFYVLHKPASWMSKLCAVLLVFAAEMIGRTLFYGLHMTVGMAVGA
ncbi:dimethyl sulfoxide reductase anchor subunit family protein [Pasteurella multocida]|uniref:dimethyl sulfoxide reductase anchor subunit family protein n=1 Tax=Pasteurella multocida TaxID=747 RepID=UPI00111A0F3A|nr:dimethyl sulfoxide reductase anchor subunit family protein [Pasteurella multocida]MDY0632631.1 dimethyl sulfoxide reductase anchor subunit [Pasteurella multocida]QDA13019.1 dimethyl sulfoxide reductase anchor subunit [Pasteurella multocida subsp. multocida]